MNLFKLDFIVEEVLLLREFLARNDISKRTLTAIKYQGGKLLVDGVERDVRYVLQIGERVRVIFPPEEMSAGLRAEVGPLQIIYEDSALLILEKPAGQYTIPSAQNRSGTLANAVAGKFLNEELPATVHVVTRLDNDTSGLLCIAKNRHIHHLLSKQLRADAFHRVYEAIVEGHVLDDVCTIQEPIGRKEGSIIERMVRQDGQHAKTTVQVIQRFEIEGEPFTHVRLILETGRTHQIRVHMTWLGHPLAGDDLYGGRQTYMARQALHCTTLAFQHPVTKKAQVYTSPVSSDMQQMLNQSV